VSYNVDYYALAHASRFVKPGAHRIYSNTLGEGSIENVAFQNPDGSKALIAYNSGSAAKTFSVADGTQSFDYTLNAGDAVTFTYSGPTRSGGTPAATNVSVMIGPLAPRSNVRSRSKNAAPPEAIAAEASHALLAPERKRRRPAGGSRPPS